MKNLNKLKRFGLAAGILALSACRQDDPVNENQNSDSGKEFNKIRLIINDKDNTDFTVISPFDGSVKKFQADFPAANLYTSDSKRYAVAIIENSVRIFDSGISIHDDHTHIMDEMHWTNIKGDFKTPVHLFTRFGEFLVFNDALGKFSTAFESQLNDPAGKFSLVDVENAKPHHGAMIKFRNGNYAVTQDDNSLPNAHPSLPEKVVIVDKSGKIVHAATVTTSGIHGDEGNGTYALFGSYNGIILVKDTGEETLIPNPSDFGDKDILGALLYSESSNKFYGRSATKGLYEIDINAKKIVPVQAASNVYQAVLDFSGENIVTLDFEGKLRIISTATNSIMKEGKIVEPFSSKDIKPKYYSLQATKKYVYMTLPESGELMKIPTTNLSKKELIKVSQNPYKLTIIGAETDK